MSRGLDLVGVPAPNLVGVIQSPGFAFFPQLQEYSALTTITADVSIHTKGAWTELIAATAAETTWICVTISGVSASGTDTRALLDIGTGAAASEVVKVANLPAGFATVGATPTHYLPVEIPKGSRVAARLQGLISAETAAVTISLLKGQRVGIGAPNYVDTYGADTANSRGTNLPTDNTYVEITSATTQPYRALVMLACGGAGTSYAAEDSLYTMAVGGSGAEAAVATMLVTTGSAESISQALRTGIGGIATGHFPKGTRIACKQATGRTYRDVIVYGVPYA